ncbi:two-component sensor histidine kinase [Methylomonas methanica]|uniref:histidine kinase n=1 Tax=Methylomonas methanica TaxID=421 RepID=A0A177MXK4_METMH|nr:ATP-binding protein [Methylomonas methanica]OAI09619.1 two-component sensor histidine kinase [Methylomonas methanica]
MLKLLLRPVIFVTIVMSILVIGELLAIGRLTWRNHQRIQTIETDIGKGHHLEETIFELLELQSQLALHRSNPNLAAEHISEIQDRLLDLLQTHNKSNDFAVAVDLNTLQAKFASASNGDPQALIDSVNMIRQVLDRQTNEEEKMLIGVEDDSQLELQLAVVLPLLLFWIGHYFFRNNVLEPLDALRDLLSGLAEGVKQPITRDTADPILRDLFDRYNNLVEHLIELEQEHLHYTNRLEQQVRQTSHALLEQSQRLAKAERLAALTEMAASTAHELRNPLAIIQVALENMLSETSDPDLRQRIGLLHSEVQRLTSHLNDLLSSARHSNKISQPTDVNLVVNDLITLFKYQATDNICFAVHGKANLPMMLPEIEFRQALLNLLQNAVQAIGARTGKVEVDIAQSNRQLLISVTDSGDGFSAALLQQGIRPFVSLKEKGSGLGLVMVQRFAKDLSGQLKLDNTAAGNGVVTLILPVV